MQDLDIYLNSYLIIGGPNTKKSEVSRYLSKKINYKLINLDREKYYYFNDFTDFDEEKYLFEDNDVYLIKVNVRYNTKSSIKDRLPIDIYVAAVNSQGKYVNVEHRFDDSQYSNKTVNGEISNWYPVFVPKGEDIKPVFVVGSPMEYPGPVAAVYYDK